MRMNEYIAVIQAGGKGTRLRELTKDEIPKPLFPLNGKPMMEWQLENIRKYGIREFYMIIGHLGDKIKEYFGDGSRWDIHISYIEEKEPLGSAGALFYLKEAVKDKNFLLVFGDVMFDMELERMIQFHENHRALATLAVHPNRHPYDSDLVTVDERDCVTGLNDKSNVRTEWYGNLVNAGLYVLAGGLLQGMREAKKLDLEKELLAPYIETGNVYGYRTTEYLKDAGTPERFAEVCREQAAGIWKVKNLQNRQQCIFLDRDGALNVYRGLLADERQFELMDTAAEAVKRINQSGFLAIVVTNQPVVARGMCGIEDVRRIHRKLETLLGQQGAYLDDIVFCPHHPDRGFPEENPAYKVACDCRKPGTGMIRRMAEKYHIELPKSYMVGDSTVDVQTGRNAGLRTVLVKTGQMGLDKKYNCKADIEAENLLEAIELILNEGR